MALEHFAGPEHYTEFDPEKFLAELKKQAAAEAQGLGEETSGDHHTGSHNEGEGDAHPPAEEPGH